MFVRRRHGRCLILLLYVDDNILTGNDSLFFIHMDEELFVHLTSAYPKGGALWYSRVFYAFESSEERTGSALLNRGLVKKVYCTLPIPYQRLKKEAQKRPPGYQTSRMVFGLDSM